MLSWQTVDGTSASTSGSARSGLLALRGRGFRSWGDTPSFTYFGGNSDLRGYDYLAVRRTERRLRQRRAALPAHRGDGDAHRHPRRRPRRGRSSASAAPGGTTAATSSRRATDAGRHARSPASTSTRSPGCPIYQSTATRWRSPGFRLVDGRASYGLGLETIALGFPIHFDWSWRTLFNKNWENVLFGSRGQRRGVAQGRASSSGSGTTSRARRWHSVGVGHEATRPRGRSQCRPRGV